MAYMTESTIEQAALAWLEAIGLEIAHGPDISPGGDTLTLTLSQRESYGEVVLAQRQRDALARLNPELPAEALDDAFRRFTWPEGADLIQRNRALHRMLVNGVSVEYRTREGEVRGAQARVLDFDDPDNNDWLAVNQFAVVENKRSRRLSEARHLDPLRGVPGRGARHTAEEPRRGATTEAAQGRAGDPISKSFQA